MEPEEILAEFAEQDTMNPEIRAALAVLLVKYAEARDELERLNNRIEMEATTYRVAVQRAERAEGKVVRTAEALQQIAKALARAAVSAGKENQG